MPNKILIAADNTPTVWANSGDYAGDGGSRTVQIDLTSLAAGNARQGVKGNLSTAGGVVDRMPRRWAVTLRIEFDVAPADGDTVDLYWAASLNSSATVANPGGTIGSDVAYTGTAGSTLEESLLQLQIIGSLMCTNDAATIVQQQTFEVELLLQYGMPVVFNNAGQAFEGDAIEMSITFTPIEDEIQ